MANTKENNPIQIKSEPIISSNVAEALFSLLDDNGNEVILDEKGQIPAFHIGGSDLITLKEWAVRNGISPATARQKAGRGGFMTARKVGRDWMISASEPRTDNRISISDKEKLALSGREYTYKILNYLRRLNDSNLPDIPDESGTHRGYCKKIFIALRNKFSGNSLKLFKLICDAMLLQNGADAYYIPHEEIIAAIDDEAWRTSNKGSSAQSGITVDFNDYLNILKNTVGDMLMSSVELKINRGTQTLFLPWYHSLSYEDFSNGGLYFVPSNFFKMIILEVGLSR